MSKVLRHDFFHYHPEVRQTRHAMGCERFDAMYRSLYRFLSGLHIGQYFVVSKMCRANPANHGLILLMCEIYRNMDFFVDLEYDPTTDRVTILPTQDGRTSGPYCPPDVYSKIIANPKAWGVSPSDI